MCRMTSANQQKLCLQCVDAVDHRLALYISYWMGDVQDTQGLSTSGALNLTHSRLCLYRDTVPNTRRSLNRMDRQESWRLRHQRNSRRWRRKRRRLQRLEGRFRGVGLISICGLFYFFVGMEPFEGFRFVTELHAVTQLFVLFQFPNEPKHRFPILS